MANPKIQEIVNRYGGNFAGSGVASSKNRTTTDRGVRFDANTNQHYTFDSNGTAKSFKPVNAPSQSFGQKLGAVAGQAGGMVGQIVGAGAKFVVNTPRYIYEDSKPFFSPLWHAASNDHGKVITVIREKQAQIDKNVENLTQQYKTGKMTKAQYAENMRNASISYQELSNQSRTIVDVATKEGDVRKIAVAAANTAATILSLGAYAPVKTVGVKAAGKGFVMLNTSKKIGLVGNVEAASLKIEDAIKTIPAFRELVIRNTGMFMTKQAQQMAGESTSQFLKRNGKDLAVGMLLKRPIIYQSNIGLGEDIYDNILEGEYDDAVKNSAWIAVQMIGGGPLGYALRNGKKFAGKVRELAVGKNSFIDEISKRIGNGSPAQIANYLKDLKGKDAKEFARVEKAFRIAQEVNLRARGDDAFNAADSVLEHYAQHLIDLATLTPERLVYDLERWAAADEIARTLSPAGGPEYVAVRWDKVAKNAVAQRVMQAGDDYNAMFQAVQEMASQPGVGWGNNQILMSKIVNAIRSAKNADEAGKAIRAIRTANNSADVPPEVAKKLAKLGYTLAEPFGGRKTPKVDFSDTRKLVSAVSSGKDDIFDPAISPHPALESIAGGLRQFGLSPESNTNVAYDKLSTALVSNIEQLGAAKKLGLVGDDSTKGGKFVLSRLQEYIEKQLPNPYLNAGTLGRNKQSALQDVRQMNTKEIMEALPGIDKEGAKALQTAIKRAYTEVPMEFRGLGMKAFDYAYTVPGASTYYRIQGALRYTYNPFFRMQEITETKLLTHMKANNLVWMKPKGELDRVSELLDKSRIFTAGYTGEATQDLTVGRIQANLLKAQKRDLSGLALDMAEKRGLTIEQYIQDYPDELSDALRVIVQYPTKGILNSPLARTLNVAFFPMRYNIKVAGLVANEVAKLPPTVQTAFIHSMFKANDWLKSPEGLQWQSDNSDAIQVFTYFTPYNNLDTVMSTLRGSNESIGEFGLLGGLPFGFISQILQAEGLISINTPYVNPKTGEVMPDYIPITTKAKAATALQGFINTMFSYPGRVLGLPGKEKFIRDQVDILMRTDQSSEYLKRVRLDDLTDLQRRQIEVLTDPNVTQDKIDTLYTSPAEGQFNWYTLPPMHLPPTTEVLTRQEVAAMKAAQKGSSGPRSKPKALPIPEQGEQLQ